MGDQPRPLGGICRQKGVLIPTVLAILFHRRKHELPLEGGAVAACGSFPIPNLVLLQGFQLGQEDGGLEVIQSGVNARPDVVVLAAGALAVDADRAQQIRQRVVVGKNGASVSVAAQRLGREEGGSGDGAEGAAHLSFVGGAHALGSILQQSQAVLVADGGNGIIITRITQEINRHHHAGLQLPLREHCLDLTLQALGGQIVAVHGHVAEHWGGTQHVCGLHRGDKGAVRAEDGIALTNAQGHIGRLKGVGAIAAADAVLPAHVFRQLSLQFLHIGTADELPGIQDRLNVGVDLRFQCTILCFQINKFHSICLIFVCCSASDLAAL